MERQTIITGNWKMHKTVEEGVAFAKALEEKTAKSKALVYLAVPFTAIRPVAQAAARIVVGGQNMNDATEGAFTGEIAAFMLKDAGAKFVLLGHSERRRYFNESNAFINRKVLRAFQEGLQPVLCVGETLEEHQNNQRDDVLFRQLSECLDGVSAEKMATMIIAYEPVWAIGTDLTATPEEAESAHQYIRSLIDPEVAEAVTIQYGGSVKPKNAKTLLEMPNIDGLLVGGASLNLDFFVEIVNYNTL